MENDLSKMELKSKTLMFAGIGVIIALLISLIPKSKDRIIIVDRNDNDDDDDLELIKAKRAKLKKRKENHGRSKQDPSGDDKQDESGDDEKGAGKAKGIQPKDGPSDESDDKQPIN